MHGENGEIDWKVMAIGAIGLVINLVVWLLVIGCVPPSDFDQGLHQGQQAVDKCELYQLEHYKDPRLCKHEKYWSKYYDRGI